MIDRAKPVYAIAAAVLAGMTLGIYVTVAIAGWTGTVSVLAAPTIPEWVGTAKTLYLVCAAGAAIAALGWVAMDYRQQA